MQTLPLTPERLRLAYKLLADMPPFDDWNMPDSADVVFKVTRSKTTAGHYKKWMRGRKFEEHEIAISARCVGTLLNLLSIMAHEMVHLHQNATTPNTETKGVQHNHVFRRLSDQVCNALHFDRLMFADTD